MKDIKCYATIFAISLVAVYVANHYSFIASLTGSGGPVIPTVGSAFSVD